MMAHKFKIVLFIIFISSIVYKVSTALHSPKYVFINETNDHRFDESIRMSIVSSKMRSNVQNAVIITNREEISNNLEIKAPQLFKQLHLGENNKGRAILFIYCPLRRLLKIEVGYELEGQLPDSKLKSLELAAKTFTYVDKFQDFWAELINTTNIEISDHDKTKKQLNSHFDFKKFNLHSGGAGIFSKQYSFDRSQFKKESQQISELKKYIANEDLLTSLNNYLSSIDDGIGDSNLDILDDESKFFRLHTLVTSYQLFRNSLMYKKAKIDKIITSQDISFVFFKKNNPVLPIVLIKKDHLWRINETLSWGLFQRFENSNRVFLKYPLTGLETVLTKYFDENFSKPIYDLENKITYQELIHLEFKNNFRNNMLKLYYPEKTKLEMQSKQLEDLTTDELKFVADAFINLGEVTNFLKTYKLISIRLPNDLNIQQNFKFYSDNLNFNNKEWILNF